MLGTCDILFDVLGVGRKKVGSPVVDQDQCALSGPHQSDEQSCFQRGKRNDRGVAGNKMFGPTQRKGRILYDVTCCDRQILDPGAPAAIAKIDETHSLAGHHHIEWAGIIVSYLPRHIRDLWLNKLHILRHREHARYRQWSWMAGIAPVPSISDQQPTCQSMGRWTAGTLTRSRVRSSRARALPVRKSRSGVGVAWCSGMPSIRVCKYPHTPSCSNINAPLLVRSTSGATKPAAPCSPAIAAVWKRKLSTASGLVDVFRISRRPSARLTSTVRSTSEDNVAIDPVNP